MQILLHTSPQTPTVNKVIKKLGSTATYAMLESADSTGQRFTCTIRIVRKDELVEERVVPANIMLAQLSILASFQDKGLPLSKILLNERFENKLRRTVKVATNLPTITISHTEM